MTTMTMTAPKVKMAMKSIGLGDRVSDLLNKIDEMALDAMLDESIKAMDRGEGIPFDQFMRELDEEFAQRFGTKRIESSMYANRV